MTHILTSIVVQCNSGSNSLKVKPITHALISIVVQCTSDSNSNSNSDGPCFISCKLSYCNNCHISGIR